MDSAPRSDINLDPGPLALEVKRAGPDGSGDLASKILWHSEDGTCPVLFHLGRGSSVELGSWRGSVVLSKVIGLVHQVAVFLGRHIPGAHGRPVPFLKARVIQPDQSCLCKPLPAICVFTSNISCRVCRVQNHRPLLFCRSVTLGRCLGLSNSQYAHL